MTDSNEKNENKKQIYEKIISAMSLLDSNKVENLIQENEITNNEVDNIANKVYEEFLKKKEFKKAYIIATEYDLDEEKVKISAINEFHYLISNVSIEEAVKWGEKTGRIKETVINKSIIKGFENYLHKNEVNKAIELIENYNIPPEQVSEEALFAFNKAYKTNNFFSAAFLGKKFGFSEKRTYTAAVKVIIKSILSKNSDNIVYMNNEFDIFSDTVFNLISENDAKFISKELPEMIEIFLDKNKINLIIDFFNELGIFDRKHNNFTLKDMKESIYQKIGSTHNRLLIRNMEEEAKILKDFFKLLGREANVPDDVRKIVIEGAQTLHTSYLNNYDYEKAKIIKDEYKLFDKNIIDNSFDIALKSSTDYLAKTLMRKEFDKSKMVIKEYKIPKEDIIKIAVKIILIKLNIDGYKDAIEILKKFKIDPLEPELEVNALNLFENSMISENYEVAAGIGLHFKLNKEKTATAASKYWKNLMNRGEFEKAYEIKKQHRLLKSATMETALQIYKSYMKNNEIKICSTIRKQYDLNLSIWELIIEFIKSLTIR